MDMRRQRQPGKRTEPVLSLFRPDGSLVRSVLELCQEQVALALPWPVGLRSGPRSVCQLLQAKEAFTFLDQLHGHLSQISVPDELRTAFDAPVVAARLAAAPKLGPRPQSGFSAFAAPLVQQVGALPRRSSRTGESLTGRWRQVLARAVRASSAVECMNSVLRMHQSRHRTLNQGTLDLKRLYWNTRRFRGGKRRGRCPYEHLGLKLPSYDFWNLLREEMTTAIGEAKAKAIAVRRKKCQIAGLRRLGRSHFMGAVESGNRGIACTLKGGQIKKARPPPRGPGTARENDACS